MRTLAILLLLTTPTYAAGHAFNENFSVLVEANPSQEAAQQIAEQVLERADVLRKQIALEWLGSEIPEGIGRTSITLHYQPGAEGALTWAKDHSDRTLHAVYIRTTPERVQRAIDEMLPHEIAHVVLATRYPHPNRLPTWIEEGIASRYDDDDRIALRRETVNWWKQTGNWPQLSDLLGARSLQSSDTEAYAAASVLVDFIVSKHGKRSLFSQEWTEATLQGYWQQWVLREGGR